MEPDYEESPWPAWVVGIAWVLVVVVVGFGVCGIYRSLEVENFILAALLGVVYRQVV